MLKAPLVKPGMSCSLLLAFPGLITLVLCAGTDVVNSLNRQRSGLEQFLKACLGLETNGDLLLETRIW